MVSCQSLAPHNEPRITGLMAQAAVISGSRGAFMVSIGAAITAPQFLTKQFLSTVPGMKED